VGYWVVNCDVILVICLPIILLGVIHLPIIVLWVIHLPIIVLAVSYLLITVLGGLLSRPSSDYLQPVVFVSDEVVSVDPI